MKISHKVTYWRQIFMDKTDEEFYDLFVKIIYGKSLKQF